MENQSTAVSTVENEKKQVSFFVAAELKDGNFPSLSDAEVMPFDLMADYWTPETKGESKRVFFDKIANRKVADVNTGELIDLDCAYFYEEVTTGAGTKKEKEIRSISNGSKRLVGAIEAMGIQQFTPLLITYAGKKNNKNNAFKSDNWSIKPLKINI